MTNKIISGIMGLCVGDAIGVPVEFCSREELQKNPVTGMRGGGSHQQPPGTWSDDTTMTLCLMDSLKSGLNYEDIMKKFLSWVNNGDYTPHGEVFDIGIATRKAIVHFANGTPPLSCGGRSELDNGNGSLMRILPLSYYLHSKYGSGLELNDEVMTIIHNVSALTHAHKRSLIACGIYTSIALMLIDDVHISQAIEQGVQRALAYYKEQEHFSDDLQYYTRIGNIKAFAKTSVEQINSSGYVVHTLEAAIWCLLTTDNYKNCILKAVNLGEDTDTVAAVAGGLAGLFYGYEDIPEQWLETIVSRDFIEDLSTSFCKSLN